VTSLTADLPTDLKDELARLERENQALRRQLRHAQSLSTVGTVTGMIVHEFNNILTPIINYAVLASSGDPEMIAKAVAKAAEGGQRASDICSALLRMVREEACQESQANLSELVQDALLAMGRDLSKDGIHLTVTIPDNLSLTTRPAELKQVLVNLVLNARWAVLKQGRGESITISARKRGRSVYLSVADTGCGIAPENLCRLFEPFFTTRTGPDDGEKGNGLGLAMCKEIVTDMGGQIRVASQVGKGTTFTLTLPA
jgi:signal transduction histidine kinase